MNTTSKKLFKYHLNKLTTFGIDVKKILAFRHLIRFLKERRNWLKQGGHITHNYVILDDYHEEAGVASGHYFHQDLLVASFIHKEKPRRHIDVASRIDGFMALLTRCHAYMQLSILGLEDMVTPLIQTDTLKD